MCSGDWRETAERLYGVFRRDFILGRPHLGDRRVWHDRRILPGESYEEGFWHLVTRDDQQSGQRLPDMERAARLCWCRPVIEHAEAPEVTAWNAEHAGSKVRSYLWLGPQDYVVVLEPYRRRDVAMLVTAYCADGPSVKRRLWRSFANRL